jgi:hypothetical protein
VSDPNEPSGMDVNDPASMEVSDFCASEAEFPAPKAVGMNRNTWPHGNFVFQFV